MDIFTACHRVNNDKPVQRIGGTFEVQLLIVRNKTKPSLA
jgi:hypothetical protein